jgi:transcriptional regulator GlxA family with amidase domain
LRAHIASRSEACHNRLLQAIVDPQIAVALKSMHEKVDALRTVEMLAAACRVSRFAIALRFKELVGEAPLEYLTSWRMQKAAAFSAKLVVWPLGIEEAAFVDDRRCSSPVPYLHIGRR